MAHRRKTLLGLVVAACVAGVTVAVPSGSQAQPAPQAPQASVRHARTSASLSVSPKVFVPGQPLTFEGNIGSRGRQRIHLQVKGQLPGDTWFDEQGFHAYTDRDGHFKFAFPGPAMTNRNYRVVSRSGATPRWVSDPRTPEALLTLDTGSLDLPDGAVLRGETFRIGVDTTPEVRGRVDLPPPAFPGRPIALQQRVNKDQWKTVANAKLGAGGGVQFPLTLDVTGQSVFRVRVGDWTINHHTMGWYPSFPFVLSVLRSAPRSSGATTTPDADARRVTSTTADAGATPSSIPVRFAPRSGSTTNASTRYGWREPRWDFAWEYGESLSSRPWRGTDRQGHWTDSSTGTGRARLNGGGLRLESQFGYGGGPGDRGTTAVTMTGNPQRYGRWEFRYRTRDMERGGRDFDVLLQLVPEYRSDYHCGANTITMAQLSPHSSKLRLAVSSARADSTWSRTLSGINLGENGHNFAVEVTRGHITWMLDSRPLASVRAPKAISGVPLTPKLTMRGDGQREMNAMAAIFDWTRSWDLSEGRHPVSSRSLSRSTLRGGC
jgi:hypothetical protein